MKYIFKRTSKWYWLQDIEDAKEPPPCECDMCKPLIEVLDKRHEYYTIDIPDERLSEWLQKHAVDEEIIISYKPAIIEIYDDYRE